MGFVFEINVHCVWLCAFIRYISLVLCLFLTGLPFIVPFSSLEREEAEDLIKRHGGRVTGSVSKKTVIIVIIDVIYFSQLVVPYIVLAELSPV